MLLIILSALVYQNIYARFAPERVLTALTSSSEQFISNGVFQGGDRTVLESAIQNIQRQTVKGSHAERFVVQLQQLGQLEKGKAPLLQACPYYQVAIDPDNRRLSLSIWPQVADQLQIADLERQFVKSELIQKILLVPRLENEIWSLVFELKKTIEIQVYEQPSAQKIIIEARPLFGN
jgi:hypothetical protein